MAPGPTAVNDSPEGLPFTAGGVNAYTWPVAGLVVNVLVDVTVLTVGAALNADKEAKLVEPFDIPQVALEKLEALAS